MRAAITLIAALLVAETAAAQEGKLDALREAAKASPDDASAALSLGRALRRAGRYAEAATELGRGAALASGRSGDVAMALRYERARTLLDRRKLPEAMAACRAMAHVPGGAALSHACVAEAHMTRKRASEALPEAELALKTSPELYEAKVVKGRALAQTGAIDDAKAELREAIAKDDARPEAHLALAAVLEEAAGRDAALAEYEKAHAVAPDDPDAAFALGRALAPGAEAAGALAAAVAARPGFAEAWARLAEVRLATKQGDAEAAARKAIELDAKQVESHAVLARVYLAERKWDDAIGEAHAALGIVVNHAGAKLAEADALAGKGDIDLAIEQYQNAFGLARTDATPLVHAAVACLAAGRDTTAKGFADRATQLFPKWGPGWEALGDVLLAAKDAAGARHAYETALAGDGPVDRDAVKRKLAGAK